MNEVRAASPSLPAGSWTEPAANCRRIETRGESLGRATTSMARACAAPRTRAAARPMPAIPAMLAIRASIFFGLVMVGTSLAPRGRLLRSGRLVRQGYEGLVLGPERLAGDPLDVRRRHRLI